VAAAPTLVLARVELAVAAAIHVAFGLALVVVPVVAGAEPLGTLAYAGVYALAFAVLFTWLTHRELRDSLQEIPD
jgi:membrane protein implicated in regulation of membrane protease activity